MLRMAFAGFRHGHVGALYRMAQENDGVEIVGAWEENEQAAQEASEKLGVDFNFRTLDELLAGNADAVVLGGCYGDRGAHAISALKKCKHIMADKPLCTSTAELDEIERLAKQNGLCVGMMLDLRCTAAASAARETVIAGKLGKINAISFGGQHPLNYGTRPSWYFEKGKHGGTINDIAIHGVDLVRYITGFELDKVVAARTWNAFATDEPEFEDCAQFIAVFGSAGLIADVSYSMPCALKFNPAQSWRFTFWGEKGIMEFSCSDSGVALTFPGATELLTVAGQPKRENVLQDFLNEIRGGTPDLCTKQVLASTRAVLKIQAAVQHG